MHEPCTQLGVGRYAAALLENVAHPPHAMLPAELHAADVQGLRGGSALQRHRVALLPHEELLRAQHAVPIVRAARVSVGDVHSRHDTAARQLCRDHARKDIEDAIGEAGVAVHHSGTAP